MFKRLVIVMVFIVCFSSVSHAFVPLAIPAGYWVASAVLHAAVAAAGVYYAMKAGSSGSVSSAGDVSRPSTVAWVDLKATPPAVVEKNITAKIPMSSVNTISAANPSKYPNLRNAVTSSGALTFASLSYPTQATVGQIFDVPGRGSMQVTSVTGWGAASYRCVSDGNNYQPSYAIIYGNAFSGNPSYCGGQATNTMSYTVNYVSVTSPPRVPATASQFAQNLSGSSSGGTVNSTYQAELDAMMQDSAYVPSFSDVTTGLPFAPPAGAATPDQLAAYNANQTALDSAKAAADSAAAASAADPTNNTLKQASLDAAAKYDALKAQQATDTSKDFTYSGSGLDSTAYGDQSKLGDFGSRFNTFVGRVKTSAVWGYVSSPFGTIPTSTTSAMSVSFGRMGSTTFDFAAFDSIFAVVKTMLLIITSFGCFKIVTLRGGS